MTLGDLKSANFPVDDKGAVYHLAVAKGQLSNRILTVGDAERAIKLCSLMDGGAASSQYAHRGFMIFNGKYLGVDVSIVSIGMGIPMMDFLVREGRYVVDGPMAIIRYGTCGSVAANVPVGSLAIAEESVLIRRNPDYWTKRGDLTSGYDVSLPVPADKELFENLKNQFQTSFPETPKRKVISGLNASADSFYSSQGRLDPTFDDDNQSLIDEICNRYSNFITLEMETFQLFHLAHRCQTAPIKAAAATIILANRKSNDFLDNATKYELEVQGGKACLDALINTKL